MLKNTLDITFHLMSANVILFLKTQKLRSSETKKKF